MTVLTGGWDGSRIPDPITAHIPLTGPAAAPAREDSIDLLSEPRAPLPEPQQPRQPAGAGLDAGAAGGAQGAGESPGPGPVPPARPR